MFVLIEYVIKKKGVGRVYKIAIVVIIDCFNIYELYEENINADIYTQTHIHRHIPKTQSHTVLCCRTYLSAVNLFNVCSMILGKAIILSIYKMLLLLLDIIGLNKH